MNNDQSQSRNWFQKHKVLTVIGAFLILFIVGSLLAPTPTKEKSAKEPSKQTPKTSQQTKQVAGLNNAVRDGKFEFVVKSVECGKATVGEQLTKQAQGQFCLVTLSVKNIGDKAQTLFSANQKLFNKSGQEFSADDTATIYAATNDTTWYSDINPGNTVDGVIVFDMPKDQKPVKAELHDSSMSSGVKVYLE